MPAPSSDSSSEASSDDAYPELDDLGEEPDVTNVSTTSDSPYYALEDEIAAMVAKLRPRPLLPTGVDRDSGEKVQGTCCGLCDVVGPDDDWARSHVGMHARLWLRDHLVEVHSAEFGALHEAAERCYAVARRRVAVDR